jgi:hypothetical protein
MSSLTFDCQTFPCVILSCYLIKTSNILLEACETFQKGSFRNRYMIASANGMVSMSIPLKNGREQKMSIRQVEVDPDLKWRREHWKTLVSCYKKAPFFEYYSESVKDLIFQEQQFLFDYNFSILKWVMQVLKTTATISFTAEFVKTYSEPGLIDLRNKWLPRNFQKGLENHNLKYSQVFEDKIGFQPNLSIIDLLFNEGPNTRNILESNIITN